jgi:outer membrane lipoprotein-sorting protein
VNNQENSNHDDLFEKATRALREAKVPDGPSDELAARVVAASVAADQQPSSFPSTAPMTLGSRIKKMKTITKIAVAASVLVATGGFFAWFAPGSQSLAFADMVKAFSGVRTARFTMTAKIKDGLTQHSKGLFMAPARERVETKMSESASMIMVFDMEEKQSVSLIPNQKVAIVYDLENAPEDAESPGTFDKLRKQFQRAQHGEENTESLGERTIDGRTTVGFRIVDGRIETKIWADPKTELPVRVETTIGGEQKMHLVMENFEYDVELDESLFDTTPPEGYTVRKQSLDVSQPTTKDLAEVLRICADNNEGLFLKKLSGKEGIEGAMQEAARRIAEQGGDVSKVDEATLKMIKKLARGRTFVLALPSEDRWHYAGADVKLGNAEKAIFWFRPLGSETYQVIYGDLRLAEDVAEEDLPKTP